MLYISQPDHQTCVAVLAATIQHLQSAEIAHLRSSGHYLLISVGTLAEANVSSQRGC